MNPYIKGAMVVVMLAAGGYWLYKANENKLPANRSPEGFQLISQMESTGVPDFTLERMDGTKLTLSSLKGKLIIVNFWASWCNPCVEEFPSMVLLAEKMKGELVVVAVSEDEARGDIEPFLKLFKLPKPGFEIVWDKDKSMMKAYGVGKIPESFIVRPDLKLARKFIGVENWASDDALLYFRSLLGEPRPPGH